VRRRSSSLRSSFGLPHREVWPPRRASGPSGSLRREASLPFRSRRPFAAPRPSLPSDAATRRISGARPSVSPRDRLALGCPRAIRPFGGPITGRIASPSVAVGLGLPAGACRAVRCRARAEGPRDLRAIAARRSTSVGPSFRFPHREARSAFRGVLPGSLRLEGARRRAGAFRRFAPPHGGSGPLHVVRRTERRAGSRS